MRGIVRNSALGTIALIALIASLPVMGQNSPESLLPPGFNDPAPPPTAPAPVPAVRPAPAPARPAPTPVRPASSSSSGSSTVVRDNQDVPDIALQAPRPSTGTLGSDGLPEIDEALIAKYALPSGKMRSMDIIGVISPESGGMTVDAFGGEGGQYLTALVRAMDGQLVSRWGHILLRRALLSQVNSPANINPADWTAERAWLLLRMGESDAARALVSTIDSGNFTPRLYEVTMQAHLANADPAGVCPYVPGGIKVSSQPAWIMFRPICSSLSGEQSAASSQLRNARQKKVAVGIDYLLAEKIVGAGFDGRGAVTIKWDDVENFNAWRYGLGAAIGVEPPERLIALGGNHVQGWRATAPMLSLSSRIEASGTAAKLGVLSNEALVDLYSLGYDDTEAGEKINKVADELRLAYIGASLKSRMDAMGSLWSKNTSFLPPFTAKILTARAAARIAPNSELVDQSAGLIGSMFTAGLDNNAARWAKVAPSGSMGWAMLAVGAPGRSVSINYDNISDFAGNDESNSQMKSKFLFASAAGLGKIDSDAVRELSSDFEIVLNGKSKWSVAIDSAAQRGQQGTVALLAAVGMQGKSWGKMTPTHLFHIVRALKQVGLEAEARMIAAEAIDRA